jgi:glycolate oxidase iron-sulfur subunit
MRSDWIHAVVAEDAKEPLDAFVITYVRVRHSDQILWLSFREDPESAATAARHLDPSQRMSGEIIGQSIGPCTEQPRCTVRAAHTSPITPACSRANTANASCPAGVRRTCLPKQGSRCGRFRKPISAAGFVRNIQLLQPEIAERPGASASSPIRSRCSRRDCHWKRRLHPPALTSTSGPPVLHTVELLDWATVGPIPPALHGRIAHGAAAAE